MFFLRDFVSRFGVSNTFSMLSFIISLTCFAFVARLSQQHAGPELDAVEPAVIIANSDKIKIAVDKVNYSTDANLYDNVVSSIDVMSESGDKANPIVKAKNATTTSVVKAQVVEIADENSHKPVVVMSAKSTAEDVRQNKASNKKNIQLGVFKSHREAVAAWFKISDKNSHLSNMRYHVIAKKSTNGQYLYLLQVRASGAQEALDMQKLLVENGISSTLAE